MISIDGSCLQRDDTSGRADGQWARKYGPWECDVNRTPAHTRYDLIENLLEQLPPTPAVIGVRRELFKQANIALARRDSRHLDKLYREVQVLAQSLGIERGGRISRRATPNEPERDSTVAPASAAATHLEVRSDHIHRTASWRRPHAPLRYPYGDPPTGADTRMPTSDILPSKPESLLPKACRDRLGAMRRARHADRDEYLDALHRVGHVARSGPDDDSGWVWPFTPD